MNPEDILLHWYIGQALLGLMKDYDWSNWSETRKDDEQYLARKAVEIGKATWKAAIKAQ